MSEFPGKVRLVYKDFPLSFHAGAEPAAMAARSAAERGQFWTYHDLLFTGPPAFSRAEGMTIKVPGWIATLQSICGKLLPMRVSW